jgi:hypothetical protein
MAAASSMPPTLGSGTAVDTLSMCRFEVSHAIASSIALSNAGAGANHGPGNIQRTEHQHVAAEP